MCSSNQTCGKNNKHRAFATVTRIRYGCYCEEQRMETFFFQMQVLKFKITSAKSQNFNIMVNSLHHLWWTCAWNASTMTRNNSFVNSMESMDYIENRHGNAEHFHSIRTALFFGSLSHFHMDVWHTNRCEIAYAPKYFIHITESEQHTTHNTVVVVAVFIVVIVQSINSLSQIPFVE